MVRVLHVITGMGSGGAEALIMNWYRNIDRTKVQFDFLLRSDDNMYSEEINKMGGKVYVMPSYPRHYIKNYRDTKEFLKKNRYKIIHVHGNALIYTNILPMAKKLGIPCRIMHSHNTDTQKKMYRPVHYLKRINITKYITDALACSDEAGKWMFKNHDFTVLKNGIEINKFIYDSELRSKKRKELGIEDKFVFGHVGKFLPSKNHYFLINVFEKVVKQSPECVLLSIGEGPLQEEIERMALDKGIADKIRFLGVRRDVNELMQAMDLFLFPSLFEGLGIVLIEAQTSGLHTLVSSQVVRECKITDLVRFLPLEEPQWINAIMNYMDSPEREQYRTNEIIEAGYDMKQVVKSLERFYLEKGV